MTDIDYPPAQTYTLGGALSTVEDDLDALDEDADERATLANQRDALQWALDQWDAEAELMLQAFTATRRADVVDTLNRTTVGPVGAQKTRTWLVMCSVETAPWLGGGEDYQARAAVADSLPPALVDWLESELEELNDLGN